MSIGKVFINIIYTLLMLVLLYVGYLTPKGSTAVIKPSLVRVMNTNTGKVLVKVSGYCKTKTEGTLLKVECSHGDSINLELGSNLTYSVETTVKLDPRFKTTFIN